MRISRFRIRNYKSFLDSGEIALAPGMNIVTGQNNAGKTALLQALELRASYKEHLSDTTLPSREQQHFQTDSSVEFAITLTGDELLEFTSHLKEISFEIPRDPGHMGPHPLGLNYDGQYTSPENLKKIWDWVHTRPDISFSLKRILLPNGEQAFIPNSVPSHSLYAINPPAGHARLHLVRRLDQGGRESFIVQHAHQSTDLGEALTNSFLERLYRFSTERFSLGESDFGPSKHLAPDARNLAEVLNALQSNADQFAEYVSLVRFVLPQVKWISVEPLQGGRLRIKVWSIDKRTMRDIISAADAREILILRNMDGETSIQVTDRNDNALLKTFLSEMGSRLSDVFGMEKVIWVEGPTESAIFPVLLEDLGKMTPGTAVISIRNTGDLESKDAERIFGIYNNLSAKASILPPSVAFFMDLELRSEEQQKLLKKLSGGRLCFVPKRNIECYLLHVDAIVNVCNSIDGFSAVGTSLDQAIVSAKLDELMKKKKYWRPGAEPENSLDSPCIDGATLLADLFTQLSDTKVEYRKTTHSVALFNWLWNNARSHLDGLRTFLNSST